jgi:hypothetical protein
LLAAIGTLSAMAAIYWNPPWLFPLIIAVSGIITIITNWKNDMSAKVRGPTAWSARALLVRHTPGDCACSGCL